MYTIGDLYAQVQSTRDDLQSAKGWIEQHERELTDALMAITEALESLDHALLLLSLEV